CLRGGGRTSARRKNRRRQRSTPHSGAELAPGRGGEGARPPPPATSCAFPEPFAVILGGVGNGVDPFGACFLPRQLWQYLLYGCDRGLMRFLIAVGQACAAPRRLALFGRDGWAFNRHGRLWFSWFLDFLAQIAGPTSFLRSELLRGPSPSSST